MIGGPTIDEKPTAVFLKSGDIAIMSRDSRLSYHAVPRIMSGANSLCWQLNDDEDDGTADDWPSESKRRKVIETVAADGDKLDSSMEGNGGQ